jgi:hypothetical protein
MDNQLTKLPFTIPAHIQWIAQDGCGTWWGYTAEPQRNHSGWYENEVGDYCRLGETPANNWQASLTRVKQAD